MWRNAGFSVRGSLCRVGKVVLRLGAGSHGAGITGWSLSGVEISGKDLDGLPTKVVKPPKSRPKPPKHKIGASVVDHIVVITPDLDRTVEAVEAAGVELRARRHGQTMGVDVEQAFFRLGEALLEVVGHPSVAEGPTRFWGITITVKDIDAASKLLGSNLGAARDAVQEGRRIATVRDQALLGLPVALITPEPRRKR
jgi:hypothetical protein